MTSAEPLRRHHGAAGHNTVTTRNLQIVEHHFHPDPCAGYPPFAAYADNVVLEIPGRGVLARGRAAVIRECNAMFGAMTIHKITWLHRFATPEWVFDDSIFDITITGSGFANCPFPPSTQVSLRLVHAFQCRDGKICRENGYEIWRRANDAAIVRDDLPAGATYETHPIALAKVHPENQHLVPRGFEWQAPSLANADPPDHTRIRRLANEPFRPRRVAQLEPAIRGIADAPRAFQDHLTS